MSIRMQPQTTPLSWRLGIFAVIAAATAATYQARSLVGVKGQAVVGIVCFILLAVAMSTHIRSINWRTVITGFILQTILAVLILKVPIVFSAFKGIGEVVQKFVEFSNEGAVFVFGDLARPGGVPADAAYALGGGPMGEQVKAQIAPRPFIFVFSALPAVIFVSSFFSVLYYLGILQFVVKWMAKAVVAIMGTSGAETLSCMANVFIGQTEAPLIVKPYIPKMTKSEILTLMTGGMAHISGGVMVAYINMIQSCGMGDSTVSILATSIMAAPCSIYMAKILRPEIDVPETKGNVQTKIDRTQANVFEAAAEGASEGIKLCINIVAMLIAFIAFVALINHVIGFVNPNWSLSKFFGLLFSPVAFLMGVPYEDTSAVGGLLGTKLTINEFVAFVDLTSPNVKGNITPRSFQLAVFALTGFANFASIGIQLGGIGAMAPERRSDLARLGLRALFGGFLATLINASIAGLFIAS
jgi:concentrative nucleoside transporter, CNT family